MSKNNKITNSMILETFAKPDQSFYAYIQEHDETIYSIEQGTDYFLLADILNDEAIEEWAEDQGLLDQDFQDEDSMYTFIDEDGSINHDDIREYLRNLEDDNGSDFPETYPSGRAFLYFLPIGFKYPKKIGIDIVDGDQPGSDFKGVYVNGFDSLVNLQAFFKTMGLLLNFEVLPHTAH